MTGMEEKNVTFNHKPTYRHEAIIFWTVKVTLINAMMHVSGQFVWRSHSTCIHVLATEVGMQYVHVWEHTRS